MHISLPQAPAEFVIFESVIICQLIAYYTSTGKGLNPCLLYTSKVLVIGSGPIVIGQAAEFDYAGTQACRSLKEEGVEVCLCLLYTSRCV